MHSASSALWNQFEGQSIENTYRLGRLIGVGGFAGVFEADHVVEGRTLRRVAVKLILAEPDAPAMQRQLDELMAATVLHHPHILSCFHSGSTPLGRTKLLYLVMEIAEGSLQSRLASGILSPIECAKMTEQIASGLVHLHQQKLVHRDVKAANILLAGGAWKLSDFGTVRQSGGATSHTVGVIGTIAYMPPESFTGTVSAAWDMWSLGVVMLEALTGKGPFEEPSDSELIGAIMQKAPTIPIGLPQPFDEIVRRCLVRNHRERWTADQVLDELKRSVAVKVRGLIESARLHRDGGRWTEALSCLNEAQQLDNTTAEIPRLIAEIEKQRRNVELQQQLADLRVRAEEAAVAGDDQGALDLWRTILTLSDDYADAGSRISEIIERQRIAKLTAEIKEAVDKVDYARAGRLIHELVGPKGFLTKKEIQPPTKGKRWTFSLAVLAVLVTAAFILGFWMGRMSRETASAEPTVGTARINPKDGLTYVWLPPGTFKMGCSEGDLECRGDETPAHQVTVTKGFWMGQTEVTQKAFSAVMGANPSHTKGPSLPTDSINQDDARRFCTAVGMRLPTEAEWEYAARGGNAAARYGVVDDVSWYVSNSDGRTHEVKGKRPNGYGLYDMLGNVAEWVADGYDAKYYASSPAVDPPGPSVGIPVIRGGNWDDSYLNVRVSYRSVVASNFAIVGVRCVGNQIASR